MLHMTVNLLILHPELHCTALLPPSSRARIYEELESDSFDRVRQKASNGYAIIDRLQLMDVAKEPPVAAGERDLNNTMNEAADHASLVPQFILPLLVGDKQVQGIKNRFDHIPLRFIVYNVGSMEG